MFKKNFCDINPTCYAISEKKEICKRHIQDMMSKEVFAKTIEIVPLPNLVSSHSSHLIKTGPGIDPELQQNKAVNIRLASSTMNGMIIHPGEVFSFWRTIGKITPKKGYRNGRVILQNKIIPGVGGGLCNLGNTINWLALHSPMDIIEFHNHSDALAPDVGERVPFSSGTSVSYNYIDYRFKNNTDQDVQLFVWCEGDLLKAELRSRRAYPCHYELSEEGHHFQKEGDQYFRVSKIYRNTIDTETGELVEKKLIWDNHSMVMFDPSLIPADQLQES